MENDYEKYRTAVLELLKERYASTPLRDYTAQHIAVDIVANHPDWKNEHVMAAVIFLYDHGKLKKRTLPRGDEYYRLSGDSIQEFAPSQYALRPLSPVTINNYGIYVNGANYGQISQNTKEAFEAIDRVVSTISTSEIESVKKMELIANAETIRAQLMNPNPDADTIKKSWNILNGAVQFGAAVATILPFLTHLLGQGTH